MTPTPTKDGKIKISIAIHGCDDSNGFDMEVTEHQLEAFEEAARLSEEESTIACMPVINVSRIES